MTPASDPTPALPPDRPSTPAADADRPDDSGSDDWQGLRQQLTQRINASPHPSRLINQLVTADLRCAESSKHLSRLIVGSPKVLRVIRAELREAFDLDPDNLLFTEPKPPAAPLKVESLTDRALQLLVLPSLSINLNQFTAISLKDDPTRRLPFTPLEVLRRVMALNMFGRLARAQNDYWRALVPGSWLTREEYWIELHAQLFADQAFVARQLDELSNAGLSLVQALVDAPTAEARQRARGQWASVQASPLMWPGVRQRLLPIPGALHIFRDGDPTGMPHVMYLPGVNRNYYEYPSFAQLQCGLEALINEALFDDLWQCLPLRRRHEVCGADGGPDAAAPAVDRGAALQGDALAFSARAVLDGQWENELACAASINHAHVFSGGRQPAVAQPARFLAYIERARQHWVGKARLGINRRQLQEWDQHRRRREIIFNSTAPGLPLNTALHQVRRYENGLMGLLDMQDLGHDTQAFQAIVALEDQSRVQAHALRALLQDAQLQLFESEFWKARPSGEPKRLALVISAWSALLRCDIELQHRLAQVRTAHRDRLIEVLDKPLASSRPGSDTRVLSVQVGAEPDAMRPLHSLFVVTQVAAVSDPELRAPVVLCAFGQDGGVVTFASLGALTQGIEASLSSRDESVLWRYVERQHREAVRECAVNQTLAVRYDPVEGNPVHAALTGLIKCYVRLLRDVEGGVRVFRDIQAPGLSGQLLARELDEHLNAPVNEALIHARATVDLVRKAATAKKSLPAWLGTATLSQQKRYRHLLGRYLANAFACEARLEQRLPDLDTFARGLLIERLRDDGLYPQVDIDTPFIEMPDHVDGRFCDQMSSVCSVGDRKEILTPSPERTRWSLLQLALYNLDPQMMPTWWRFRYARYLEPAWKQPLNAKYLVSMIASLDIGGQYETLITRTFYPPDAGDHRLSDVRVPELSRRALRAGAEADLYSAVQQGLTPPAQSLFTTAMAASTAQGLRKNTHQLQLYVVHLVGHTLLHDRYIAGILVVHDLLTLRCVVYWPTAPGAARITEHASLTQAGEYLNRIGALPENVTALARQVAPGWAFEAINHHPGETSEQLPMLDALAWVKPGHVMLSGFWRDVAGFIRSFSVKHLVPSALDEEVDKQVLDQIASASLSWLALVPTSHHDAMALLYRAQVQDLQRKAQANSHSARTLRQYRKERLEEQSVTRTRKLLAMFLPGFGIGNQVYELLVTARRYHRYGDPRDAVDLAFGALFLLIDLLLTFIPVPKSGVGRPKDRSRGVGLSRLHRSTVLKMGRVTHRAQSSPKVARLKPLAPFRIEGVPQDAVALKGPGEQGVYVKHGEHFVVDDTHHYPVYRRAEEGFFRLKNRQAPGVDELVLNIQEPRVWLLGADAPVAGPSSGVLNPWRAPVPASSWRPPALGAVRQTRIAQSQVPDIHWFGWRTQVPLDAAISADSGVFHVDSRFTRFPYNAIYVGGGYDTPAQSGVGYYRLLHQGQSAPLSNIVFISKNEPLASRASFDIARWTSTDIHEQPLPASRTPTGDWQVHARLFDRSPETEVGLAFARMTEKSRQFAVARVLELTDASYYSVTASHLLGLRATLDDWLVPNPLRPGQTDDLLRMLRPLERRSGSTFIGNEGEAPGFIRVDFTPSGPLGPALKAGTARVTADRKIAQRAEVRTVLEQQGFVLDEREVKRSGAANTHEMVATHPGSDQVYYICYQWVERTSVKIKEAFLSDSWIRAGIKFYDDAALSNTVREAMRQQRLVRILAGIHWSRLKNLPPTVYFVKVNPL